MLDMDESFEDQPLGYLLSRVANTLRAEVTLTVLDPLAVAFPQYLCMRVLSKFPGRSNADLARALNVSPQATNMVLSASRIAGSSPGGRARHWADRCPLS